MPSKKLECSECGRIMKLRKSRYGLFYGCSGFPECRETHGAHQHNGMPLGIPADAKTRKLRTEAHEAFDLLWKGNNPLMSRTKAYAMLASMACVPKERNHISMLSADECRTLIESVEALFGFAYSEKPRPLARLGERPEWRVTPDRRLVCNEAFWKAVGLSDDSSGAADSRCLAGCPLGVRAAICDGRCEFEERHPCEILRIKSDEGRPLSKTMLELLNHLAREHLGRRVEV